MTDTSTSLPQTKAAITLTDRLDRQHINPAASTLSASFPTDPVLRWVLTRGSTSLIDNTTFRDQFFKCVVSAGRNGGGTISSLTRSENEDVYDCVGILIPPGHDPDTPGNYLGIWREVLWLLWSAGLKCSWRILFEYPNLLKKLKASTFSKQQIKSIDYYYVFFLGTLESARGQGLASAWLRRCQETAWKDEKAIWLESSTEHSRDLYLRLGWEIKDVVAVGKGMVDKEGKLAEGGEGARLWGMVWRPDEGKPDD